MILTILPFKYVKLKKNYVLQNAIARFSALICRQNLTECKYNPETLNTGRNQ